MVQCQKLSGKCRRIPADRRERTVSHDHQCRSMHGSTRSSSRQCSVIREQRRHHSLAFPWTYRVRGLKSCSSSRAVYQSLRRIERTVGAALRGRPRLMALYSRARFKSRAATEGRPYSTFHGDQGLRSFFSRNWVILACSVAARRSSVSESWLSRSCSAASISSEVLPEAQIMKIKPNFCS